MRNRADRVEILGVDLDPVTQEEAVECALDFVEEGGPHQIWTPSISHLMLCRRDPDFAKVSRDADLVVADGMPVVWMSRLNRTPLPERVTGADLLPVLCEAAAGRGYRVFFLGAAEGVADEVARRMSETCPGLVVAGTCSPPVNFENDPAENERTMRRVVESKPDILFVALGTPRQEKWIQRYREQLGIPVMIGVGAAFNFAAGRERRAPVWLQQWGLESLWRMIRRPREILGRILRNAPLFFLLMLDQRTYRSQKSLLLRIRPVFLALLDALVAAGGFVLAYMLYFRWLAPDRDPFPNTAFTQIPAYSTLVPFVVIINFLVILGMGLYRRGLYGTLPALIRRTAVAASATWVFLIAFTFVSKEIFIPYLLGYSRGFFALFGVLNFAGLTLVRTAVRILETSLHELGLIADRLILIGERGACEAFAAPLLEQPAFGQIPLGRIHSMTESSHSEEILPDLGSLDELRKIVAARKIDEIVLVDAVCTAHEIRLIVEICGEFKVRLSFLPQVPIEIEQVFRIREIGNRRLLSAAGKDLNKIRAMNSPGGSDRE
ncbi:MAG TPA: WecB/TagA/CpsF family glycosyltransferase [bacterium]|nr:WecB/TagA/CpsF family glycosyltransferase [bacterium]